MKNNLLISTFVLLITSCISEQPTALSTTTNHSTSMPIPILTQIPSATPTLIPPTSTETPRPQTLKDYSDQIGLEIGIATGLWNASNFDYSTNYQKDAYLDLLGQFDRLLPMGAAEAENTHTNLTDKASDTMQFQLMDWAVRIAVQKGMRVRGEPLLWNVGFPEYADREWMINHITTLVSRYNADRTVNPKIPRGPGEVDEWSFLEPLGNYTGKWELQHNVFFRNVGSDYLEIALQAAHQANPNAKLMIDENNIETINPKSDYLYSLVQSYIEKGIPIHSIGIQFHLEGDKPIDKESMIENIRRFKQLGLRVDITSLSVNIINLPPDEDPYAKQGEFFASVLDICVEAGCNSFAFWGLAGDDAWNQPNIAERPTLYDEEFNPRSSYFIFKEELQKLAAQ